MTRQYRVCSYRHLVAIECRHWRKISRQGGRRRALQIGLGLGPDEIATGSYRRDQRASNQPASARLTLHVSGTIVATMPAVFRRRGRALADGVKSFT